MSSNYLKIFPSRPDFIPSQEKQDLARIYLQGIYENNKVNIIINDEIEFVDQGELFESVCCNLCNSKMEMAEWQVLMDKAYSKRFRDLYYITTCCLKPNSLNDVHYNLQAGFARFILEIEVDYEELSENQVRQLEYILGADIRLVWALY